MATDRDQDGTQEEVIRFLADLASHGGAPVTRIDTHGAVVFLAGDRALKLKRAVKFPFLDFSTLPLRKAACDAEIRINRPGAPQIYLGVEPVVRRPDGTLALGGVGAVLDYVVVMRRFDETATLDRLAATGILQDRAVVSRLVDAVLASHAAAERRESEPWLRQLATYVEQNAEAFPDFPDLFSAEAAATLTGRSRAALAALAPLLRRRGEDGFVRRCHGDLHLRNIVLIDGVPTRSSSTRRSPPATCSTTSPSC